MSSETIVAVFKNTAEADEVVKQLKAAGVDASAIEQHAAEYGHSGADATLAHPDGAERKSGFWSWVLGEEGGTADSEIYDTSLAGGGVVLSVIVSDAEADMVAAIIEQHHPVDMHEMAAGTATSTTGTLSAHTSIDDPSLSGVAAPVGSAPAPLGAGHEATAGTAHTAAASASDAGGSAMGEVVALAEEQLEVGKRVVERGVAKIRRYVVERPVEEQIRLRSESVRIERRPVSAGATVAADAFTEKTIEVRETAEEAVVGKTAHVVEEVVIGKDVSERVETVRDTVRREQLDVIHPAGADAKRAAVVPDPV